ncbi:hypothetical protein EON64_17075 [archaeon]|nr:MAG: hypothetical protein EON64_17075 [archaeon]
MSWCRRRVLQLTPKHTNTLYNYAVLLDTHLKRRAEAEQFYRRTLELESRHAFALYNLAVLLEELMAQQGGQGGLPEDQKREVAALYKRAVDADPRDPATLADYGRYLYMQLGEVAGAEQALQAALKQDAQCESALYHLALLTHKEQRSAPQATALLQRLLVVHPQHVNGLLALARVHADTVRSPELAGGERDRVLEQCVQLYEQAASLHREPAQVLAEYLRVLEAFGTARMKVVALRSAAGLLPKIDKAAEEDAVATCRALMDRIQKSVSY